MFISIFLPVGEYMQLVYPQNVNILEPVVQSTISVYPRLPVNLLFWFRLFWLNNLAQISQLKTYLYTPKIC